MLYACCDGGEAFVQKLVRREGYCFDYSDTNFGCNSIAAKQSTNQTQAKTLSKQDFSYLNDKWNPFK